MLQRPRRNRRSKAIRGLIRETRLHVDQLVQPLFLIDGKDLEEEVPSLPGSFRRSTDKTLSFIEACLESGIRSFILFPAIDPKRKDKRGSYGMRSENFYLEAARKIKEQFPNVCLISDVALDPYSSDGHDGLVRNGRILNDETLPLLAEMAILQADAGFDLIGPSDMMDGRVQAIREALDDAGFIETGIMSYTAKYASAFYGPFRDALDSAPAADPHIPSDKKTYQMDPANRREARVEAELDELEGADFLMVKPALHYLDVIRELKENTDLPVVAYHVSGECALLIAASQRGWLDFEKAMPETLLSIARAGADVIITYFAKDYADRMKHGLPGDS